MRVCDSFGLNRGLGFIIGVMKRVLACTLAEECSLLATAAAVYHVCSSARLANATCTVQWDMQNDRTNLRGEV